MTRSSGEKAFAEVVDSGSVRLRLVLKGDKSALFGSFNEKYLQALADHINTAFHAKTRPLVEALENLKRAISECRGLAEALNGADKALEAFRK